MKGTERRFILSLALTGLILTAEVAGGLWTHSLALLSDAGHVALDLLALGMSYAALRLAARPADDRHTYGFHRWQVIAALVNGATLFLVSFGIFREAWIRLREPAAVLAGPMLVVAIVGLVVNLLVALVLREHDHDDLNVRSAFLHVLGDALSSVGVIIAGVVMLLTGWTLADPLVSVLIGAIILAGSGRVLREALHILVEGAPAGVTAGEVSRAISAIAGVSNVHDLHVWTVSPGYTALSAHVVLADQRLAEAQRVQDDLRAALAARFGIRHTTVQFECADCGQGIATCANGQ
ncbi:MAG: cation diffusion facilitator family transporter [Chloroflexi bacterium]|nr:cation diffusion facilitator family transporter [Chloroflexota bacterium]